MPINPVRLDPSRTTTLRQRFIADMNRRFVRLKRAVVELVEEEDAFDLDPQPNPFNLIGNARFAFRTDEQKLAGFRQWFGEQLRRGVLEIDSQTGQPWTSTYVNSAYRKGIVRAYIATHAELLEGSAFFEGAKAQFLVDAFAAPETVSKLQLLYTRPFEELKGITAQMSGNMNRILADGIAHGHHPSKIARAMTGSIDISRKRALVIARTETINAHAEGQLDGLERLGVEEVEAEVEFMTSGDSRVCPKCQGLSGRTYTISAARGVIPVHPNCRCSWSPVTRRRRPRR